MVAQSKNITFGQQGIVQFTSKNKQLQQQFLTQLRIKAQTTFNAKIVPSQKIRLTDLMTYLDGAPKFDFYDIFLEELYDGQERAVLTCDTYNDNNICIKLIYVPQGYLIPLHDHPNMMVISKMLLGQLRIQAFDWIPPQCTQEKIQEERNNNLDARAAQVVTNSIVSEKDYPWILFPNSGGNIHSFEALTPCIFIDIISPPYCCQSGRTMSFYEVKEQPQQLQTGDFVYLQKVPRPQDYILKHLDYSLEA